MNGLRGPGGARQRLAEIQARIASFSPKQPEFPVLPGQLPTLKGEFAETDMPMKPYAPFGAGMELSPQSAPELQSLIQKAAAEAGIEANLLDALVASESSYDPRARSRAGAMGLTQLMPGTAAEMGVTNPFDPEQSLRGGAKYLKRMLDQFGDPKIALAAYNSGPGTVLRAGGKIPNIGETKAYVAKVMSLYEAKSL